MNYARINTVVRSRCVKIFGILAVFLSSIIPMFTLLSQDAIASNNGDTVQVNTSFWDINLNNAITGEPYYCIEFGAKLPNGSNAQFRPATSNGTFNSLSASVKKGIGEAYENGYRSGHNIPGTSAPGWIQQVATQTVIWEYQTGERTQPNNVRTWQHDTNVGGANIWSGSEHAQFEDAYQKLLSAMNNFEKKPSFDGQTLTMTWNPSSRLYEVSVNDSNSALSNYSVNTNNSAVSASVSGNTLKLTSSSPVTNVRITMDRRFSCTQGAIVAKSGSDQAFFQGITSEAHFNATVNATTGKIARGIVGVTKYDEGGSKRLQGAEFTLTDEAGVQVKKLTDANGFVTFDITAGKTYRVDESNNPKGYTGSFSRTGITMINDGQPFFYYAYNTVKKGTITLNKVDQSGSVLSGAEFTLIDDLGVKATKVTDNSGVVKFDIFGDRTYNLEETKAPSGYSGTFKQSGISLKENGQNISYRATNTKQKRTGYIFAEKYDQDGGTLSGAEFTLKDDIGRSWKKTTDSSGRAIFNIEEGRTYSLEETKNPEGYTGSYKKTGIKLPATGSVYLTYKVTNQKKVPPIKVTKVDDYGNPVASAKFTLTDDLGKTQSLMTGTDGILNFDTEVGRTYSLEETSAPTGFKDLFKQTGIKVTDSTQPIEITATNHWIKGKIKIHKVDENGKGLPATTFKLTNKTTGREQREWTDENGELVLDADWGVNTLEEDWPAAGYVSSGYSSDFVIDKEGQVKEVTIVNQEDKSGKIIVVKKDQDGNPLAGAEFTLSETKYNSKQVKTTDKDGKITFDCRSLWPYRLTETKNPEGYTGDFDTKVTTGNPIWNPQQTVEVVNTLKKGTISVHKEDENKKPIIGAQFTLTDQEGSKQIKSTDSEGLARFDIVGNKTYTLEETRVPNGFTGSFKKTGITLKDDGEDIPFTVINKNIHGKIKINKVDSYGNPLEGAEFTLYSSSSPQTQVEKTDKNGEITFEVPVGMYKIEETKNPEGYTGEYKYEGILILKDGQEESFTVTNKKLPSMVVTGGIGLMLFIIIAFFGATMWLAYFYISKDMKNKNIKKKVN